MWRDEAQGLLERRTIPSFSMLANSALAAVSFTGSNRWARAWTGSPHVDIWCTTPWLATAEEKFGLVRLGNWQSSRVNSQSSVNALDRVVVGKVLLEQGKTLKPSAVTKQQFLTSTNCPLVHRKSTPRRGLLTSANTNSHVKRWTLKHSGISRFP